MSTYNEAHKCASSYVNSPELYQIITRRIIERNWFPVVNRAGFHCERPDSHLFLEQWIPFDLSNLSTEDYSELENSVILEMEEQEIGEDLQLIGRYINLIMMIIKYLKL